MYDVPHETAVLGLHTLMYLSTQVYTSLKRSLQFLIAGRLSKLWIKFIMGLS